MIGIPLPSGESHPTWLQQLVLGQAEAWIHAWVSQVLGPSSSAPVTHISEELDQEWGSWDWNCDPNAACWHVGIQCIRHCNILALHTVIQLHMPQCWPLLVCFRERRCWWQQFFNHEPYTCVFLSLCLYVFGRSR